LKPSFSRRPDRVLGARSRRLTGKALRRELAKRLMKTTRRLTAIIEREDDAYVAPCPELDIASQGDTVESARKNLVEALELFFESADATEVARRLHGEVFVTQIEVLVG
jgi:predicted RNase H-like HicB family nuclease